MTSPERTGGSPGSIRLVPCGGPPIRRDCATNESRYRRDGGGGEPNRAPAAGGTALSNTFASPDGAGRTAGRAILWGGLICGVLDITSAVIISLANGGSPVRMLQGITGSLLGPVSFQGGSATAALGLAMHFGVAFTATAVFYWLSRRFPAMVEWAVPSGLLYGIVWLLVMYRGVIPLTAALRPLYLSNIVKRPLPPLWPLPLFVHLTCVGLPIALAVRQFGPRTRRIPEE